MNAYSPFSDKEDYFLDNIKEYRSLTVLSFTPSFIMPELNHDNTHRNYARKMEERLSEKNLKTQEQETILYLAERGLKKISGINADKRNRFIEECQKLEEKSRRYRNKLQIYVVDNENLPPVSLFIGEIGGKWSERAPVDIFIEYRVGINDEILFDLNNSRPNQYKWFPKLPLDKEPEEVKWIMDKLNEAQITEFTEWFEKQKDNLSIGDPTIAIVSAMATETSYYRKDLMVPEKEHTQKGRIIGTRRTVELVFPTVDYGRVPIGGHLHEVFDNYPSVNNVFFVGVAGGAKEKGTKIGDVVISQSILSPFYEKLYKGELKGKSEDRTVIELGDNWRLAIKKTFYPVDDKLIKLSRELLEYTVVNNDKWLNKIESMIDKYLGPEGREEYNRLTENKNKPPKIIIAPIWSSDHNVNLDTLKTELVTKFDIAAFDMESGGLAEACKNRGRKYLVIRGISDLSNDERPNDDLRQKIAAITASAALELLLAKICE
jgi:nucleoside phosphorylase